MKHTRTHLLARLALSALLTLLLIGPAAAKPGNGHGKGHGKGHSAEARGLGRQGGKGGRGKAVKVAARCPIKGKAKGKLVSSIARDKDATAEDAREACARALEQQGEAPEELEDDSGEDLVEEPSA